jgi:hypothetical protein
MNYVFSVPVSSAEEQDEVEMSEKNNHLQYLQTN